MSITYLKRGKPEAERAEDDAKTRQIVEATLKDIETRGDAAVRELSEKFDGYTPDAVSYTHLRAHETRGNLVCRLLLEKKK